MSEDPLEATPQSSNIALQFADRTGRARLKQLLTLIAAAQTAYIYGRKVERWIADRREYIVTINAADSTYQSLHDWLSEKVPDSKKRALSVFTSIRNDDDVVFVDDAHEEKSPVKLRLRHDVARAWYVTIDGYRVRVSHEKPASHITLERMYREQEKLIFRAASVEGRDAVLRLIHDLAQTQSRLPSLFVATRWGSWERRAQVVGRPLDSVILGAGELEDLTEDLRRFMAQQSQYELLGLPWHRGYLFHGPPGTGKTSTAHALATALGLDLYYVPLSDLNADADLINLVCRINKRAVLLLEDIDVAHSATARDDDGRTTLAGLLNALDGVATPQGLITIMTSNHPDALDEALLRKGRVDWSQEFKPLDAERLSALVYRFTGHRVRLRRGGVPSDVLEHVKRHLDKPADAAREIEAEYG